MINSTIETDPVNEPHANPIAAIAVANPNAKAMIANNQVINPLSFLP